MEKSLGKFFRLCVFSGFEEASVFVRSASKLDVLVTDLDLGVSAIGGCNIAREVRQMFPESPIFAFSGERRQDHRLVILRAMKRVKILSKPFGAIRIVHEIKKALNQKNKRGFHV